MSITKANPVRKVVRSFLAAYFWLRPLIGVSHLHFPTGWLAFYHRVSPDAFLLLFIAYYALLSEGGWWAVALDLVYVYLWPLFLLWLCVKHSSIRLYRAFIKSEFAPKIEILKKNLPNDPAQEVVKSWSFREILFGDRMVARIVRPFSQFILLWALLILNSSNRIIIMVALAVIAVGAIKIVRNLVMFLSDAGSWILKFKSNFTLQVAENIAKVRAYTQGSDPDPLRGAANILHTYEIVFRYLAEKKDRLARWTLVVSILITVPFYLYLSLIFTSIYLGVARLNHIVWSWTDALTTAIFIPFAFTDLPHNLWIRLIGGLQALTVTVLGYTVLFRRIQYAVQQMSQVASELHAPLSDEDLKKTVALLNVVTITPKA